MARRLKGIATADQVPPGALRVLLVVMRLAAAGERVTVKRIGKELGGVWNNAVHQSLSRLRAAGLVTWDYGRKATLRPAVWWEGVEA